MKLFWRLHRWLGVSLAFALLWMTITGFLLNRSEDFGLDELYVSNALVLDWFGISMPEPRSSHTAGIQTIASIDQAWYWLDHQKQSVTTVLPALEPMLGIVQQQDWFWVASTQKAWLMDAHGELIETVADWPPNDTRQNSANEVRQLGHLNEQVVIELDDHSYWASQDGLSWQSLPNGSGVQWAQSTELSTAQTQQINQRYLAQALSWEDMLLRLHNGALVGDLGKWLLDIVALGFILLASSGLYLWFKTRRLKK